MLPQNPFEVAVQADADDRELVHLARDGSREALEALVAHHQAWLRALIDGSIGE